MLHSACGIIIGAHRLWSHRSFEAALPLRIVLMICNSIANEGTIYRWCRDHKIHHRFVDTVADPHNSSRGFFFSHIGWLIIKKHPATIREGQKLDMSDLLEDCVVRFQKKCDPWWNIYWCFFFPAQVSMYFFNDTFWNGFLVPGALRYLWTMHCTWLVNSAAHYFGDHPYDTTSHPTENPIVSMLSFGEGWHSFHHHFPFDYAASEFGVASQFNPAKLIIDACARVGLVWGRKRATRSWALRRKRRDADLANGIPLPKLRERNSAEETERLGLFKEKKTT